MSHALHEELERITELKERLKTFGNIMMKVYYHLSRNWTNFTNSVAEALLRRYDRLQQPKSNKTISNDSDSLTTQYRSFVTGELLDSTPESTVRVHNAAVPFMVPSSMFRDKNDPPYNIEKGPPSVPSSKNDKNRIIECPLCRLPVRFEQYGGS